MTKRRPASPPSDSTTKKTPTASPLEAAREAIEAGNYSEASDLLKGLLDKDPGHEPARLLTAQLHLKSGSLMAAKAAFESLTKDAMQRQAYGQAEEYLREYLGAAARYVPFLELLGQVCAAQGKAAEAVTELAKAVTILLEFPDPEDRIHAEQLFDQVRSLAPDHPEVAQLAAALNPPSPQETPATTSESVPSTADAPPAQAEAPSVGEQTSESPRRPDAATEAPSSSEPEPPHRDGSVAPHSESTMAEDAAPTPPLPAPSTPDAPGLAASLAPRQADLPEMNRETKATESVELISLEDWLHEPLSPVPLATTAPAPPARSQRDSISLPDRTGQVGPTGKASADPSHKTRRGSKKDGHALAAHGHRAQIGVQSTPSVPDESPLATSMPPVEPDRTEIQPDVEQTLPESRQGQQEQAGVPPEDTFVPDVPAASAEVESLGQPSLTNGETPFPVKPETSEQMSPSPLASLDPDLKAELATFLREKTPLTDRAQVFSPPADSQPAAESTPEPAGLLSQEESQPVSETHEAPTPPTSVSKPAPEVSVEPIPDSSESWSAESAQHSDAVESAPSAREPLAEVDHDVPVEPLNDYAQPGPAPFEVAHAVPEPEVEWRATETPEIVDSTETQAPTLSIESEDSAPEVPAWEPGAVTDSVDHADAAGSVSPQDDLPASSALVEAHRLDASTPMEEPAWTPIEETDEATDQSDEPVPEEQEDLVAEQPSEPTHEHGATAQPCALCLEAEAEEASRRRGHEGLDQPAATPRSGSRLGRPFRQVKRWVRAGVLSAADTTLTATRILVRLVLVLATMTVGLPFIALCLITAGWLLLEQSPNANYVELTQAPPRAVEEPTRNGYYLLLGFGAGESVDPIKAGYLKWKTTERDESRHCFGLTAGARASMAFSAETRALALWLQAQDPVAELQRERSLVQRWAARHGVLMARYQDWLNLPFEDRGYGSFASPDCAQVLTAHRLYLADGFSRRQTEGLDRLERDLIAWRNVLARSKTMSTKLLAAQAVREDLAILGAIAERGAADAGTLPRFAHLVRPFDPVERSLRWPMQNELLLEVRRVEAGLTAKKREAESGWVTALLTRLPIPKQRALNAHADYYEALIRAPEQGNRTPPDAYTYTKSPAQDAWDYLLNPVDNLLLTPDYLSWQQEAAVLFEADTRLRALVASKVFQPRPGSPLTATAQLQSDETVPTLVSEASPL